MPSWLFEPMQIALTTHQLYKRSISMETTLISQNPISFWNSNVPRHRSISKWKFSFRTSLNQPARGKLARGKKSGKTCFISISEFNLPLPKDGPCYGFVPQFFHVCVCLREISLFEIPLFGIKLSVKQCDLCSQRWKLSIIRVLNFNFE